jgi:metallo-beta-lactamase family protein
VAGAPALRFLGAAGTVTGSMFVVTGSGGAVMVDCGLFQGERRWRRLNWSQSRVSPGDVDDVVLTHSHLDHCGYLPALVRRGWAGPVWATEGTRALAEIVLLDSAHLQEEDALHAQREGYSKHSQPQPLYRGPDVQRTMALCRPTAYGSPTRLAGGALLTLHRAGHVLGSASAHLEVDGHTVLFSGDLGRPHHPLLRAREAAPAADTVVVESTYGDRSHPDAADHEVLADAVRRTVHRGGSVLVPAFAVDRTELVLLALAGLMSSGRVPPVPVFVDSPMALATLATYGRADLADELLPGAFDEISSIPRLHTARTPEESARLNRPAEPSIVISASGMASGGRVVHHLRAMLPDRDNTVVLTGYQTLGTRGRSLQDGAREVKMMGQYVPVRAEVVTDGGFSVHADADELVSWLTGMPAPPRMVYVVHGDADASGALADRLRKTLDCAVVVPDMGERVLLS